MEVELISRKTIKPTSSGIHHQEPFKLSVLDQFFPTAYFPIILFYPENGTHSTTAEISVQLQKSLSETLSVFYMFSGTVKNESYIDNYEEGVPFSETKVNIRLSEFLQNPGINMLNQFLPCPCPPFTPLSNSETSPPIVIQLNSFECGGVALGLCFFHKVFDATTAGAFLKSWAANHTGESNTKDLNPNLLQTHLLFPKLDSLSLQHFSLQMNKVWFGTERKHSVRRYVFDAEAIATLRTKARSERVDNPTRIETISSFIWKHFWAAFRKISDSPTPSLSIHAVNIRQRIIPPLPKNSIGNVTMLALAAANFEDTDGMELHELVSLTRDAISDVNAEFISQFEGENCSQAAFQIVDLIGELLSQKPEIMLFTSWVQTDINDFEFGLGKPLWSGVLGEVGPIAQNFTIFKEPRSDSEDLEAWMMLEEPVIGMLEQDSEFLAFATPNPSVL